MAAPEQFSQREQEIISLMVNGFSNQEIAQKLVISKETVRWYNKQIYSKLGAHSRREATAYARRLNLAEAKSEVQQIEVDHNLPNQPTLFIGREGELEEIHRLFSNPAVQLLTILAPGGMGKTRLSIEIGRQFAGLIGPPRSLQEWTPDGVYFVPLAPLNSSHGFVNTLAACTGYWFQSDERDPEQQICDYLSAKRGLLILDSFEHVLAGVGLVSKILAAAPDVKILVTSRERLNLLGEMVYTLGSLGFPDEATYTADPEAVLGYDAVRLFMQRVRLVRPDFDLRPHELNDLARICALTQGMPLAIELAAAWGDILPLQEIAAEIALSLDFLQTEMHDVPARQRSIRAVFNSTWVRLSESEQAVFMKVSVFRGGFTRQAGESIAETTLYDLNALASKALIKRSAAERYEIHDLMRQYAEEKLDSSGEGETVRDAHSRYYLEAVARREGDLKGRDQLRALDDIESDIENVQAAWIWAAEHGNFQVIHAAAESLFFFFDMRARFREGVELFRLAEEYLAAHSNAEHELTLAHIQAHRVRFIVQGFPEKSLALDTILENCIAIARKYRNHADIAFCLMTLAALETYRNEDYGKKEALLKESLRLYYELEDEYFSSDALHGLIPVYDGHPVWGDAARLQEVLELKRKIGDTNGAAWILYDLMCFSYLMGAYDEAENFGRETIEQMIRLKTPLGIIEGRRWVGTILFGRGDLAGAEDFLRTTLQMINAVKYTWGNITTLIPLSWIMVVLEDYVSCREFLEQVQRAPVHAWEPVPESARMLAACGTGQYQAARKYYQTLAERKGPFHPFYRVSILAVEAIIQAHEGQSARAAELLGCAFHQPRGISGWLEKWGVVTRLREKLETELGTEAYNSVWQCDAARELDSVVAELLEEAAR